MFPAEATRKSVGRRSIVGFYKSLAPCLLLRSVTAAAASGPVMKAGFVDAGREDRDKKPRGNCDRDAKGDKVGRVAREGRRSLLSTVEIATLF